MQIKIKENGHEKEFVLEHKEISLFSGDQNVTSNEPQRFEAQMGYFCPDKGSWIFPSPLDAIKAFESLRVTQ